jgi:hypothetical protein
MSLEVLTAEECERRNHPKAEAVFTTSKDIMVSWCPVCDYLFSIPLKQIEEYPQGKKEIVITRPIERAGEVVDFQSAGQIGLFFYVPEKLRGTVVEKMPLWSQRSHPYEMPRFNAKWHKVKYPDPYFSRVPIPKFAHFLGVRDPFYGSDVNPYLCSDDEAAMKVIVDFFDSRRVYGTSSYIRTPNIRLWEGRFESFLRYFKIVEYPCGPLSFCNKSDVEKLEPSLRFKQGPWHTLDNLSDKQ